jgi:hypothetical protein
VTINEGTGRKILYEFEQFQNYEFSGSFAKIGTLFLIFQLPHLFQFD